MELMKPLTDDQRALYDIAIDPIRTRDLLLGLKVYQNRLRAYAIGSFIAGLVVGVMIG